MRQSNSKPGTIYYQQTETERAWVNPGAIPTIQKLFSEIDNMNARLRRLENSLVKFADSHDLSNDGTLESVIGALCNEVQIIKAGKQYTSVELDENSIIQSITKSDVLIQEQEIPENVIGTYYTVMNGRIVEHEETKNKMEVIFKINVIKCQKNSRIFHF